MCVCVSVHVRSYLSRERRETVCGCIYLFLSPCVCVGLWARLSHMKCCLRPSLRHSCGPRPRERNSIRTHFLFEARSFRLARRRLECETGPDFNGLPPSRIGRSATQLRTALFRARLSGADDSSLLFWRFPVLSWAKGSL